MKKILFIFLLGIFVIVNTQLHGQKTNCFLYDYQPKIAVIPPSIDTVRPTQKTTVTLKLKNDTIGKVSKYVFGNAIAAWCGSYSDTQMRSYTKVLAPTLIRWPGGSWADGWFLNEIPDDVPDSVYDGTKYNNVSVEATPKSAFGGHTGKQGGWVTTTDQYYALRKSTNVNEGLMTVNYGYARLGTSKDPVARAAHEAANWVRYDNGRTKFWEIGNENGGPWEYGWMIDTKKNQDGQPVFISGELYGKHFKVFVDSMKAAAREVGATIYIGGQVMADAGNVGGMWGTVNKNWNQGFFKQVGDSADFYVIHNYFNNSSIVKDILIKPGQSLKSNADYVRNDILKYNAYSKPIALTEYNMNSGAAKNVAQSFIGGMQAAVLMCEMIKNDVSLGARWFLNGEFAGSEYGANYTGRPKAEFYYLTFLQKFFGDIAINSTSTNSNILSYASRYSSGETGLVVVNTSDVQQTISLLTDSVGVGDKYYIYTFTSNTDSAGFSPTVYINNVAPNRYHFGPYTQMFDIKAMAYPIDGEIKFTSPRRSLQMIVIEKGNNHVTAINSPNANALKLQQNFPNPVCSTTHINYELPESVPVALKVYDTQGRMVKLLVNEFQNAGNQSVEVNVSDLQNGMYFYKLDAGHYHDIKKMIVQK